MTDPGGVTKGERTRLALLDAAITRFGRDGYRRTSVSDIARDVGLSTAAAYAYFPNKEALFIAAVDEDTAREIDASLRTLEGAGLADDIAAMLPAFMEELERHPLARRVLAGLEPDFTVRLLGIGALEQARKAMAERFVAQQLAGGIRGDVDPVRMSNGIVLLLLSMMMSLVQIGTEQIGILSDDVVSVFDAALRPPTLTRRVARRPGPGTGG